MNKKRIYTCRRNICENKTHPNWTKAIVVQKKYLFFGFIFSIICLVIMCHQALKFPFSNIHSYSVGNVYS